MQRHGVDVIAGGAEGKKAGGRIIYEEWMFVAHKTAGRQLLAGTPWAMQSIDQILCRINDSFRGVRKIAGMSTKGAIFTLDDVDSRLCRESPDEQ